MKLFRTLVALVATVVMLSACASDYDQALETGKKHACELKGVLEKAKADPADKALQEQAARLGRYVQIQRELSGDADAFNEDLAAATRDCK